MRCLVEVETPSQWQSRHSIRREVLFDTGVFPFEYDEGHPDDRSIQNTPYLLLAENRQIGAVRLDHRDANAVVRLVAIRPEFQRQGNGRVLSELLDAKAIAQGITELRVNAFVDAIGFYEKTGWQHSIWDEAELADMHGRGVQMIKRIGFRADW